MSTPAVHDFGVVDPLGDFYELTCEAGKTGQCLLSEIIQTERGPRRTELAAIPTALWNALSNRVGRELAEGMGETERPKKAPCFETRPQPPESAHWSGTCGTPLGLGRGRWALLMPRPSCMAGANWPVRNAGGCTPSALPPARNKVRAGGWPSFMPCPNHLTAGQQIRFHRKKKALGMACRK
jgi:hypothetical protein